MRSLKMAKKRIPPDQQTEELGRAAFEFLKRNPEKFEAYKKQIENIRPKTFPNLESMPEELKIRIQKLLLSNEYEYLQRPAADGIYYWWDFWRKNLDKFCTMTFEEENARMLEMMIRDAQSIFSLLTYREPSNTLLIGVDLRRTKAAIMAEIEKIVDENQFCYRGRDYTQTREKWLPLLDELLQVWDLYSAAGRQPVKTTFRQIAKKVGRPLSTVRDQWLIVYGKIFDEQYKLEEKYSTEEKRASADELCAKCPHATAGKTPKCYRSGDFIPCAEYLRLAGKERMVKSVEFGENIDYESKKKDPSE